jgi:hypothetical protein
MDEWNWMYARDWVDFLSQRKRLYLSGVREALVASAPDGDREKAGIRHAKRLAGEYEQEYLVWRTKRKLLGEK